MDFDREFASLMRAQAISLRKDTTTIQHREDRKLHQCRCKCSCSMMTSRTSICLPCFSAEHGKPQQGW